MSHRRPGILGTALLSALLSGTLLASSAGTDGDYTAWVTNSKDGTLSAIDLSTYTVLGTIPVGNNPRGVVPAGDVVVVAAQGADQLVVVAVDGGTVVMRIPVGHKPYDVAIDPRSGSWGWVSLLARGQVQNVAETGVQATVDVGRRPVGVAFDPKGRQAAVACSGSDKVYLLPRQATTRGLSEVAVGRKPMDVAFDKKGRRLLVSNFKDNTVTVIDARKASVDELVAVGRGPRGVAWSPTAKDVAAVVQSRAQTVRIIEGNDAFDVAVGKKPIELAFTPDGKLLVVTNAGSNDVSVVDVGTHTVVTTVPVGSRPWGVAITATS